jgi:hypothetical protein
MDFSGFADYFVDTAALGGLVLIVVAFAREHILTTLKGWTVIALSVLTGAVLGAAGHFAGLIDGGLGAGLAFGVGAGFFASGGWDGLRGILGKASPS